MKFTSQFDHSSIRFLENMFYAELIHDKSEKVLPPKKL